jgi:multimeric flavodoxin WrbA
MSSLSAIALNCSLKPSPEQSSTDVLLGQLAQELEKLGCSVDTQRVVDLDIKPGVTSDEGKGDDWPGLRKRILDCDILVLGSPIWLGQPSSVVKRVLERMDAFLSETDEAGRYVSYGKVGVVAVVGNEDGAHHVSAELFQALNEVGFSIPASAVTYWVGEAMQTTDYIQLQEAPEKTASATAMVARNATHLARLLKGDQYPGAEDNKEQ